MAAVLKHSFVIDRNLHGVPVEKLLDARHRRRRPTRPAGERPPRRDGPVLEDGQALEPGRLYRAEHDPTARYYLPKYTIAEEDGHPQVLLHHDPQDGEVGRLTITLAWKEPRYRGGELRRMDHRVALSLRHQLPIDRGDGTTSAEGQEEIIALQPASIVGERRARSVTVIPDVVQFASLYHAMRDPSRKAELLVEITADVGLRTWKQVVVGRPSAKHELDVLERRNAMFASLLRRDAAKPVRTLGGGRAEVALRTAERATAEPTDAAARIPSFDASALLSALPSTLASLISGAASRTPRPQPSARSGDPPAPRAVAAAPLSSLAFRRVPTATARLAAPMVTLRARPPTSASAATPTRRPRPPAAEATVRRPRPRPRPPAAEAPALPASRADALLSAGLDAARFAERLLRRDPTALSRLGPAALAALALARTPTLKAAIRESTLELGGKKVVPTRVVLDARERPAVIDTELETKWAMPFHFDAVAHPDVYVGEAHSTAPRLLLPLQIAKPDGSILVAYRDSLLQQVVYVPPTGFRLVRDDVAPFAPTMTFLASDFGTTSESSEEAAEVLYRVAIVYRLEPWVDPTDVALIEHELAEAGLAALVSPIMPREAELTLTLPELGDAQVRHEAKVDPATGITDTLELDGDTFTAVWRDHLMGPAAMGIRGEARFVLFDGTAVASEVRISLREKAADLLDVIPRGPVPDRADEHDVVVRNRIESPVELASPLPIALPGGGAAVPITDVAGVELRPQQEHAIRFRLTDPQQEVAYLEPVVFAHPHPDQAALLGLLMANTGYESLGFSITVRAAAGTFASPSAGTEPLVGLRVEFDDGTIAELSSERPQAEVGLLGRLVDQLLGTADEEHRYFFRVTNLHPTGEGARTSWTEGRGEGQLEVASARVTLDF